MLGNISHRKYTMDHDFSPDSLLNLAFACIKTNWYTICEIDERGRPRKIRDGIHLPWAFCDRFVKSLTEEGKMKDIFIFIFSDPKKARLRRVYLRSAEITDIAMMKLMQQDLIELNIQNCNLLTDKCLPDIVRQSSLRILNLSHCPAVLQNYCMPNTEFPFSQLRSLNVGFTELGGVQLHCLMQKLPCLSELDVSKVVKNGNLTFLNPVRLQLRSLVLHNCMLVTDSLQYICTMKNIRHLDISICDEDYPLNLTTQMLKYLVKSLPYLLSLDLSGNKIRDRPNARQNGEFSDDTSANNDNFRQPGDDHIDGDAMDVADARPSTPDPEDEDDMDVEMLEEGSMVSDIKAFKGMKRPFQFLGLLFLEEGDLENIPALEVASLNTEEHILTTIDRYQERRSFVLAGINAFFDHIRIVQCRKSCKAVQEVVMTLKRYPTDSQIQISGSALLFHLSRNNYKAQLNTRMRQGVIDALLSAIENVPKSLTLLRNCGLTLLNFDIPSDFYFQFERVMKNLIKVVPTEDPEGLLPRIYAYMCNTIVCHVEGEQKLQVGKLGIIKCMLDLIMKKLRQQRYDEVMETAWSALWNVTDETADNCEMFVEGGGLNLFLESKELFKDKPELMRNMMGLIGNVAEVKRLRHHLMQHVETFMVLLRDKSDGIEVSYNAAGTLSHIASDGPEAWTSQNVSREAMLYHLELAVDSWELKTQRNINYRSFDPILRLIDCYHTPQVQLWSIWAIANLCTVTPDKYCKLLVSEKGDIKIKEIMMDGRSSEKLRSLIKEIITIMEKWREQEAKNK